MVGDGRTSQIQSFGDLKNIEWPLGLEHDQNVLTIWVAKCSKDERTVSRSFSNLFFSGDVNTLAIEEATRADEEDLSAPLKRQAGAPRSRSRFQKPSGKCLVRPQRLTSCVCRPGLVAAHRGAASAKDLE